MKDEINFDDFQKVDIRIGTVTAAVVPEWSHWVMKLAVDFGDSPAGGGERTIFSGIMKFYAPEDLIGKQFPFVINLKPKKIGPKGDFSEGMMIMAVEGEGEEMKPTLINTMDNVPNGTRVS